MLGPGQTDEGSDIVSQLHITFPASATNIVGAEHSVSFLMPNDQWRAYVAGYYPDTPLRPFPVKELNAPLECIPAVRAGVKLVIWSAGDDIPYKDTDQTMFRSISVTPDCEPGEAHVEWMLDLPE